MASLEEQVRSQMIMKDTTSAILKLADAIKQQIPAKIIEIRKDIYQSFKYITSVAVEEYFVATYGASSFDFGSLQASLIFIPSANDLVPKLSYDPSMFRFNTTVQKNRRVFNQNANEANRKTRQKIDSSYYVDTGLFSDFYESSEFDYDSTSDTYDEDANLEDILMDFENFVPTSNRNEKAVQKISVQETYQQAIAKAIETFYTQYQGVIKPRILKKYKINLL